MADQKRVNLLPARLIAAAAICAGVAAYAPLYFEAPQLQAADTDTRFESALIAKQSQNWAAAVQAFEVLGNAGHTGARYEHAVLLLRGWGVPANPDKAREMLLQVAVVPSPYQAKAAFELGNLFRKSTGDNCQEIAFEWFSRALELGHPKAHAELGRAFLQGLGVKADLEKALGHFRQAALLGSAHAVWPLLRIVAEGNSQLPADREHAAKLFSEFRPMLESEAKAGGAQAARTLGRILLQAAFVPHEEAAGKHWLALAAELGDPAAMHDHAMMRIAEGDTNSAALLELLQASAGRGYGAAMTTLARLHLKSQLGLEPQGAIEWLRKGMASGHGGSFEEMARLLTDGTHVEKDAERALTLARQAEALGQSGARQIIEKLTTQKPESTSAGDLASRKG